MEKLLSSKATGDYLLHNLQTDARRLMLISPQFQIETNNTGGYATQERQLDLAATTKRELLNRILDLAGLKYQLKAIYVPLENEIHDQPDDMLVKDIRKILDTKKNNERNNEKIEDRVNRVSNKKTKTYRNKIKPATSNYYLSAITGKQNTAQNISSPKPKQRQNSEDRSRLKGICTPCKNQVGNNPISEEILREVCLRVRHKQNQTPYRNSTNKPSTNKQKSGNPRQLSPRAQKQSQHQHQRQQQRKSSSKKNR